MTDEQQLPFMPPRIRATRHGETLGWYDTIEEAESAIEADRELEEKEE